MVGMFTTTPRGHTYILVAVDKFIKWVEARPIAGVSGETATLSWTLSSGMVFLVVLLLTMETT
jgi:hypothetical protein